MVMSVAASTSAKASANMRAYSGIPRTRLAMIGQTASIRSLTAPPTWPSPGSPAISKRDDIGNSVCTASSPDSPSGSHSWAGVLKPLP